MSDHPATEQPATEQPTTHTITTKCSFCGHPSGAERITLGCPEESNVMVFICDQCVVFSLYVLYTLHGLDVDQVAKNIRTTAEKAKVDAEMAAAASAGAALAAMNMPTEVKQ